METAAGIVDREIRRQVCVGAREKVSGPSPQILATEMVFHYSPEH
jgi:hypothetical protein